MLRVGVADMRVRIMWAKFSLFVASALALAGSGRAESTAVPPAEPARECRINQKAWCFQNASAYEITLLQKLPQDASGDWFWRAREATHPASTLVVIEPSSCQKVFADEVRALGYKSGVAWRGEQWDAMDISLRRDGQCTLRLLVTPNSGSPWEWAYSQGRSLMAACGDVSCSGLTPTIVDVTNVYRDAFFRKSEAGN